MSLGLYIHYILTLLTLFEKRSKQLRIVNSMLVFFLDIYGSHILSLREVSGIYVINVGFKSTRQFSAFEINVLASDSKEYTLRYKASKWIFIFIMVMRHFLVQAIFSLIVRIMLPRAIYFNLSTTKIPHDLDLLNSGCLERWIII